MPTTETLERYIALVEQSAHVEAVEQFYAPDASMQENQSEPRVGRDSHAANERRVLAKAKKVTSTCVRPIFVSGDNVVTRWIFRFEWLDGTDPDGGVELPALGWRAHPGGAVLLRPGATQEAPGGRKVNMSERAEALARMLIRNFNDAPMEREQREPLYDTVCARLARGTAARKLGASIDTVAAGMRSCP